MARMYNMENMLPQDAVSQIPDGKIWRCGLHVFIFWATHIS
jgi:hypothetical protein